METSTGKPYLQTHHSKNNFDRIFEENVVDDELVWHRDKNNRAVTVLNCGEGWKFQYENKLPFELYEGLEFHIEKETFHRILKGKGNLLINIREFM